MNTNLETRTEKAPVGQTTSSGQNQSVQKKSALRSVGYEQGAAMLTPVQMKGNGEQEYQTEGPNAGYSTVPKKFQDKQQNYHESMLPGGEIHAKRQEEKFAVTTGTLTGFFQDVAAKGQSVAAAIVGNTIQGVAATGGSGFIEAEGILNLPLLEAKVKLGLDIKDKGGGKLEVSGKTNFGTSLGFHFGFLSAFSAAIKGALGGQYEVKAVGDSMGECMRLIQIGMELAMDNAAADHVTATEEQEHGVKEAAKSPGIFGAIGRFFGWVKNLGATAAEWSMKAVLKTLWVGESGKSFDERLALALAELGETDMVEISKEGALGLEGEVGVGEHGEGHGGDEHGGHLSKTPSVGSVLGVGAKVEGGLEHFQKKKLLLNHENKGEKGKLETETGWKTKLAADVDLSKVGIKGKLEYEWEKETPHEGHKPKKPTHKLTFETSVAMGGFGAAAVALTANIWARLSEWLEKSEKNDPASGKPAGASEASIAGALTTGYQQLFSGIGANVVENQDKGCVATAIFAWESNNDYTFHYVGTTMKSMTTVAKTPENAKLFGYGLSGSVKTGYKQSYANKNVESYKRPEETAHETPLPKNHNYSNYGSE